MSSQPTDPRTLRSRAAMLAAASELLQGGGMAAVTHQAVAVASGVGRATVYRHWPRPLDLLLATLQSARFGAIEFGDGPIRDELFGSFIVRIGWFNQSVAGTVVGALVSGAEHDEAIASIRDALFQTATANMQAAIAAAATRAELKAETPARTIATLIIGAIMYERHQLGSKLTPETLSAIIDTALAGWWSPADDVTSGR